MSQKLHLKKASRPCPKALIFLITFLIALLFAFLFILSAGKKLETIIIRYATSEATKIATTILNDVVRAEDLIPEESLYTITKDQDGYIQLLTFNTETSQKILADINERATKRLVALENGKSDDLELSNALKGTRLTYLKDGIVCDIPIGVLLGNSLLVNVSPSIPLRFSFIGSVTSNLKTKVTPYGINNALVEVVIEVTITEQITMPHRTERIPVTEEVSLMVEMIQGQVPSYYFDSLNRNSQELSLPFETET